MAAQEKAKSSLRLFHLSNKFRNLENPAPAGTKLGGAGRGLNYGRKL